MTPESVVALQLGYGSDIMMQLDHVLGSARRTRWRSRTRPSAAPAGWTGLWPPTATRAVPIARSVLFGIQQGGMDADLRDLERAAGG